MKCCAIAQKRERGGELEKSKGRWALTWIMNPEEYLKRRRKECYIRYVNDTKSKRSVEMCLILIEVTFIVVLRKRGLGRGQIYRFIYRNYI